MTAKKKIKQPVPSKTEDTEALRVAQQQTETAAEELAHKSLRPEVQAALTLLYYNKTFGEMSINTVVEDLEKQCELASNGDLARTEALLTAQAHTLDAIFNNLARRAATNAGEYMNACELYLRFALKAQSQCRATLETLAAIKNPQPVAFVQQANIAHGPQQVNNGRAEPGEPSRAREPENAPNKLLETKDGERLEPRTTSPTSHADKAVATVGQVDRTKNRAR